MLSIKGIPKKSRLFSIMCGGSSDVGKYLRNFTITNIKKMQKTLPVKFKQQNKKWKHLHIIELLE